MACPCCSVSLVMSDRQGIEIDYCPQCRGVWLDRGELDKIIERSMAEDPKTAPQPVAAAPQQPAPAPYPTYIPQPTVVMQPGYHQPYYHKRKHWLSNLFDD